MASSPHSQSLEAEPVETQNPNFAQDEENQQESPQPPSLPPEGHQEPEARSQLQSPESQIIETLQTSQINFSRNHQEQQQLDGNLQVLDEKQHENQDHPEQQPGNFISASPFFTIIPPATETHVTISHPNLLVVDLSLSTNVHRWPNKRKKVKGNSKKQQAIAKKIQILIENLNPIPFTPSKTLDFCKHEKVLKWLGLWDFVHIRFDKSMRVDLIAQLITNYDPKLRHSYVNDSRILVNRADLARSLKLPMRREKGTNLMDGVGLDSDTFSESISFVEDLVSNYVLLHEDMWMMPGEIMNWIQTIKDGNPDKVDWAGLIWFMVEKELTRGEQLRDCYYASHLLYLIKSQHKPKMDVEFKMAMKDEEDGGGDDDVKMSGLEEPSRRDVVEEPNTELTLWQDVESEEAQDEEMIDVREAKENEYGQCLLNGRSNECEHSMQCCNLEHANGFKSHEEGRGEGEEEEEEEEGEEEVDDGGVDGDANVSRLEEPSGEDVVEEPSDKGIVEEPNTELTLEQDVAESEESYEEMMDVKEAKENERGHCLLNGRNSEGKHFMQHCNLEDANGFNDHEGGRMESEEEEEEEGEEEADDGFNIVPNDDAFEGDGMTGNLLLGMEINQIPFALQEKLCDQSPGDFLASRHGTDKFLVGPSSFTNRGKRQFGHVHDISHSIKNSNKRLRSEARWDTKSSEFGMCMEQAEQLMEKARMMYEAKNQAYDQLHGNQQLLVNELERRGNVINHLQKTSYEDLQKKDAEIFRLERELYLMGNLLDGYRKALKKTQKAFSEYRQSCRLSKEPIYSDAGPGGIMLSTNEIEKQRLQQEENRLNCSILEHKYNEVEELYMSKFEEYLDKVHVLDDRLMGLENNVKSLKELFARRKIPETSECPSNE